MKNLQNNHPLNSIVSLIDSARQRVAITVETAFRRKTNESH